MFFHNLYTKCSWYFSVLLEISNRWYIFLICPFLWHKVPHKFSQLQVCVLWYNANLLCMRIGNEISDLFHVRLHVSSISLDLTNEFYLFGWWKCTVLGNFIGFNGFASFFLTGLLLFCSSRYQKCLQKSSRNLINHAFIKNCIFSPNRELVFESRLWNPSKLPGKTKNTLRAKYFVSQNPFHHNFCSNWSPKMFIFYPQNEICLLIFLQGINLFHFFIYIISSVVPLDMCDVLFGWPNPKKHSKTKKYFLVFCIKS